MFFASKIWQTLTVIAMAVVLLIVIFWGLAVGKLQAQSEYVLAAAQNVRQGLEYFYSDQQRFPTAYEFAENTIMEKYFNQFPPLQITSSNCSQNFLYTRTDTNDYALQYCLPEKADGLAAGWHSLNN